VANSAPANLKATYFAVMASFTNLALAASQLGTVYLNRFFVVKRGDYAELGELMIVTAVITLAVPLAAVALVRALRLKVA
jgi:K+-sensing histidine kinase KdpD